MKTQNTYPVLNINYSKDSEKSHVKDILSKATWYKKQGYAEIVRLPGNTTLSETKEDTNKDALLIVVEKEYDEALFCKIASGIQEDWLNLCKKLQSQYMNEMSLSFHKSYEINLTRYGTNGSYDEPNKIILNIHNKEPKMITRIIFHEILHLAIEPLIRKYKVRHWRKERIVDLIYKKLLPEFSFTQKIPEDTQIVDDIFKKYTNDIDTIIKNCGV
jgi:hypothetical protein